MLGAEKNEACEDCIAANKKTTYIGVGAGALLGAGLCFVVLRYVAK